MGPASRMFSSPTEKSFRALDIQSRICKNVLARKEASYVNTTTVFRRE